MKLGFDSFWAKKSDRAGRLQWLSLHQHLEDTVNVSNFLWENWLGENQKNVIMKSLGAEDRDKAKKLALFIAAVHDLGKATPAFQLIKGFGHSFDLDEQLIERLSNFGFKDLNNISIESKYTRHQLISQMLLAKFGVKEDITTIVGGHHGSPVNDSFQYEKITHYLDNVYQSQNPESEVYKRWEQEHKNIFLWALNKAGFNSIEEIPSINQASQVILSGLLIMADWIASNEKYFPLMDISEEYFDGSMERQIFGISAWKKNEIWNPYTYTEPSELFEQRFGFSPREVQAELANISDRCNEPGILILEAPMGIGKTEAALVSAEILAEKGKLNGVYFGLPTQATSNGIFPRILNWVKELSIEADDELSIHLSHSKARLNPDFYNLAANIEQDSSEQSSVIINEWFSGKKTISLDDFVVGTVDLFLMTALKQKHLALRHFGFSRKVIVLDEVHAYDAYMNEYLLRAIEWMGAYQVPLIILSATLPEESRIKMVKAYLNGRGFKWDKIMTSEEIAALKNNDYPIITYTDGAKVLQKRDFTPKKGAEIEIRKLENEEIISTAQMLIHEGGVLGIIVNTVKRAQELALNLFQLVGEEKVELLHSGFISKDRIEKEKELLEMIGKNSKRPFSKIIIGTQVIEQSLDIDFDVLISDLAPMDLLIQRIGRLHRHEIQRPKQHVKPVLYVVGLNENFEFDSGSDAVYGSYLLARTQALLPDKIYLPRDIPILVQGVYRGNDLELGDELHLKMNEFKKDHDNKLGAKSGKASTYLLGPPKHGRPKKIVSLIGWLSSSFPSDSEEQGSAKVRDIESSLEVLVVKKVPDGYGLLGTTKDLSDEIDNPEIARKIAEQSLKLPQSLSRKFNIDSTIRYLEDFNQKKLSKWQSSPWLKGALGIVLDENNQFTINQQTITYDRRYGIFTEREGKNGTI